MITGAVVSANITVTLTLALRLPYVAFTTVAPAATAVILPALSTVATAGSLLDQFTFISLITLLFWSKTVAFTIFVSPAFSVADVGSTLIVVGTEETVPLVMYSNASIRTYGLPVIGCPAVSTLRVCSPAERLSISNILFDLVHTPVSYTH